MEQVNAAEIINSIDGLTYIDVEKRYKRPSRIKYSHLTEYSTIGWIIKYTSKTNLTMDNCA